MQDLPVELKLQIIEELRQIRDANSDPFCGVALVWPDVIVEIRRYRFHTICLRHIDRVHTMIDLIQSVPSISELVRAIWILRPSHRKIYEMPEVKQLFSMLPLVSSVRLHNIPIALLHNSDVLTALPPTVTNVDVHTMCSRIPATYAASASRMFAILDTFQSMQRLELRFARNLDNPIYDYYPTNTVRSSSALREINILGDYLGERELVNHLLKKVVFENLTSLVVMKIWFSRNVLDAMNRLMSRWNESLREVRLFFLGTQGRQDQMTLALPPTLELLEFHVNMMGMDRDPESHSSYIDFWARTLQARLHQGRRLRSLVLKIYFPWPLVHSLDLSAVRRLDVVVGGGALVGGTLTWHLEARITPREEDNGDGCYDWLNTNAFPKINEQYLVEDGRGRKHTKVTTICSQYNRNRYQSRYVPRTG
ncbi:hypothetical protein CYLTODRAFT_443351 [Cylindrobasidium torrendii FP15055 ss-10]|uniref:F-box domain-containing protein n=1 Tax=Cylindrobasidium torrendii FP15055 ss-10 TaxID=1314674 RepID=A0A0D7BCZ7_9AGAR|nr:hypothetical protein CYLTODRAFT_443351 [Cylindrobasidium torrendii FP15055 ss-10]